MPSIFVNTPKLSRKPLSTAITAILLSSIAAQVNAQDSDSGQNIEEVFVTGSRIARDSNLGASAPIQTLNAEDIQRAGEISLIDVVNDIPALLNSATPESSIDSATFADGSAVLNLRGLGSDRTLVLVNGLRHVAGVEGTASVDIGSIPTKLVDRVEVLTGGASAVYGSDAVTGVVNFILKENFEGFELDIQGSMSGEGDSETVNVGTIYGINFAEGRGNLTVAADYRYGAGLQVRERDNGLIFASGRDWTNPDLRFQQGDISSATPNFEQFFNFGNTGEFRYGLPIPSASDFIASYTDAFDSTPTLTQTELDLISRAENAAPRAVLPFRTFPFTSGYGYIIPGNPYTFEGFDPETNIDLDGNGRPDCLDSFSGYNSVFGASSFGVLGGCWNVTEDGTYRPVRDGLVAGNFEGFGGDSFNTLQQPNGYILLPEQAVNLNILGHFEISPQAEIFTDLKYVEQETENEAQPTAFWDLLFGAPDNPYLPDFIRPVAEETGGVAITSDPIGLGSGRTETERTTMRAVFGIRGDIGESWSYEVAANYGKYERETRGFDTNVIVDRFFSSIDAVTNPDTGAPDCRVNLDPDAPQVSTPFNIPVYDPGYFTFTPGDGSCVPLNIWAGAAGITDDAVAWVTDDSLETNELEQTVISAVFSGDSEGWLELPAGSLGLAFGAEWREETSEATFDDLTLGILPETSAFTPGDLVETVSDNSSLVFRPALKQANAFGEYDVTELFAEVVIPLAADIPEAHRLDLELAARYADYSTIGTATSYKANLVFAPVEDLVTRVSFSRAVRAPNITELFGPLVGTTFRPTDVCNASDNLNAQTQANCVEYFEGIGFDPFDENGDYVYTDPLSAAFGGLQGGNPDLTEETSTSRTLGFVLTPSQFEGFSLSIDYWDIEIEDAIVPVSADDIVRGCFLGPELNDQFCDLLSRNDDPNSQQFGGLNFIQSVEINFAALEASGFDFTADYSFDALGGLMNARVTGTRALKLDQFSDPSNPSFVNPELEEVNRPKVAGNIYLGWESGPLSLNWQTQYLGKQLYRFVEIEEFNDGDYDRSVLQDPVWIHDLGARYEFGSSLTVYGGVNNVTEEEPFITNYGYPASARGRVFFLGVDYKI